MDIVIKHFRELLKFLSESKFQGFENYGIAKQVFIGLQIKNF